MQPPVSDSGWVKPLQDGRLLHSSAQSSGENGGLFKG